MTAEPKARRQAFLSLNLVFGGLICLGFLAMAALALVWTPFDPLQIEAARRLLPPSAVHIMGTDHFGRDVFSMILAGSLNSISVAVIAVGVGMIFGVPLGLIAAGAGGIIDELVSRLNDLVFAFPALLLAIMLTAVYGPSLVNAIVAIGIFNVPVFARIARGSALSLWSREFILAARVAGKGPLRISAEHILPNLANILIVQGTIQFSLGILAEAGLSYVGLGTPAPEPSWGRMLAESQTMFSFAPWLAIYPGAAILISVLGLNLLGDGLRDWLDPRLARVRGHP